MKNTRKLKPLAGALALAAALLAAHPASGVTWTQWSSASGGNDHWYGLTDTVVDWLTGNSQALVAYPGSTTYLVAINSAEEQDFLSTTFGIADLFFIGLADQVEEGNWSTWANGEPVTFSNWYPGEPNDYGTGEDYTIINWRGTDKWNDANSSTRLHAIIERVDPATTVPDAGSTLALFSLALAGLTGLSRCRRRR